MKLSKALRTELAAHMRRLAANGGRARAARLTADELSAIGRQGAAARWAKRTKKASKTAA